MCVSKLKRTYLILLAILLSACSANPDKAFKNTDEFIVQIHDTGKRLREYKIQKGSEKYKKLETWAKDNEWGWSPTPTTYVPGIVVKGGNYEFNFLRSTVVVNNPDGQYSKGIDKSEYEYLL